MAKTYTGSLNLEWYNKQYSILLKKDSDSIHSDKDIPAPKINWVNKDEALFYEIVDDEGRGLQPYWVDRNDIRVKEARPLIIKKVFKGVEKNKSGTLPGLQTEFKIIESKDDDNSVTNFLIKGDNLLALNSLNKLFENLEDDAKIMCAYFDIPYNTGQAFENYEDNIAHSEWLTLIRDRMIVANKLLSRAGTIFIQIDYEELHYLKVVLDEIFGRDNLIAQINWQRSPEGRTALGQGLSFLSIQTEYVLIYAKDKNFTKWFDILKRIEATEKVLSQYNILLKYSGEPDEVIVKGDYTIRKWEKFSLKRLSDRYELLKNFDSLVQSVGVQEESSAQQRILSLLKNKDAIYEVDYTLLQGKNKGQERTSIYHNGRKLIFAKDYSEKIGDKIYRSVPMNDFWQSDEIQVTGIASEGNVTFKRSKKPEKLLQRILELTTEVGDTVLDIFGGSGTTLAVAHKMQRKWIGVEIGKHADTHILPRLIGVLDGSDNLLNSDSIKWHGGGSFKYYHLGPSIISINKEGTGDFNWELGKKFIEESFLLSYDYLLDNEFKFLDSKLFTEDENSPLVGIQKIGSKTRVAVISLNEPKGKLKNITFDEMEFIYKTIKKKYSPEYINIFTNRGVEIAYDSKPDDLEIIKIPNAIFSELEK